MTADLAHPQRRRRALRLFVGAACAVAIAVSGITLTGVAHAEADRDHRLGPASADGHDRWTDRGGDPDRAGDPAHDGMDPRLAGRWRHHHGHLARPCAAAVTAPVDSAAMAH